MAELAMASDDEIIRENIEAAKAGDEKAFSRLITIANNTVTSIALSIVKDIDSSEEIAQKVYISVWHNLKSLKNNDSFLPWIRQATRYQAFNFIRDNKASRKISGEQADQLFANFCDPGLAHEHALEREQQSAILSKFINDLPEESREIVLLYYREEQSTQQVSKLLGISEANVRKKLSRVRATLKQKILQKHGRLILSTAPTLGFTTIIINTVSTSSPVAAATLAASASSAKMPLVSKLLALLGGAMIGAAFGAIAIYWQANICSKKVTDQHAKRLLLKNRNQTVLWIIISGLLLTASYEFTSGWIMPVSSYILFIIVLFALIRQSRRIIARALYSDHKSKAPSRKMLFHGYCNILGTIIGLSGGFLGLYIGLINAGRL